MRWISGLSGMVFGLGLTLSGMVLPSKVQNFLDVSGNWDPSLALVMGGALLVFMPGYFWLVKPRAKAVDGSDFHISRTKNLDSRLLIGSALFGVGWGLVGIWLAFAADEWTRGLAMYWRWRSRRWEKKVLVQVAA